MKTSEKVIEIIADVLDADPAELSPTMGPHNLEEWDSVNALRILTNIEAELKVRLSLEQFASVTTIGALTELIQNMILLG
ncbi:acyl carrier protein [Tumebacillus permanentifrigoris]|uniref:Acyl carrier protein n=1 Tax=Tumebacillus permanentifrigoris TaxID=378543 RepID=A0A316DCC8_9BACL|nr:acyl carrier protein [Tumebacillus permanentifrigoris]PWK14999.1 acyl carrier protein [Tumebacillus permanentifrigoris]